MEVLKKYVKAFKFGKWPNGKEKWVVGQWVWGDNEVQYIFPENFESRDEAMKWIKVRQIRRRSSASERALWEKNDRQRAGRKHPSYSNRRSLLGLRRKH